MSENLSRPLFVAGATALKRILATQGHDAMLEKMIERKDQVIPRYQAIFNLDHCSSLTEEEFRSFLLMENNLHWTGLHRQGGRICSDMPALRDALSYLFTDEVPVEDRLNRVVSSIKGMGKAIATAVLHVVFPDKYGVWNRISESALKEMKIFPRFERGESFGSKYVKVNSVLNELAEAVGVSLWCLDALLWRFLGNSDVVGEAADDPEPPSEAVEGDLPEAPLGQNFALEKHLQHFLWRNWELTDLAKNWDLYREHGEPDLGYEFPCGVGRIDILARAKAGGAWLVIELKKNQTSDSTVGQVLRYMGWVRQHLAEEGELVQGLIIAKDADDPLRYALSSVQGVEMLVYEVSFRLSAVPAVG